MGESKDYGDSTKKVARLLAWGLCVATLMAYGASWGIVQDAPGDFKGYAMVLPVMVALVSTPLQAILTGICFVIHRSLVDLLTLIMCIPGFIAAGLLFLS